MPTSSLLTGRLFAVAATLVTAPRLMLAFLTADGIALSSVTRTTLLCISSIATAIAVTGGAAYLAHALVVTPAARRSLGAIWVAALLGSSGVMAPLIVSGLAASPLAATLTTATARWVWAILAVLTVDLVAAGTMRAEALSDRHSHATPAEGAEHQRAIAELRAQSDQALLELRQLQAEWDPSRPQPAAGPLRQLASRPRPRTEVSPAPHGPASQRACECGKTYPSPQAFAGHRRWCSGAPSARTQV